MRKTHLNTMLAGIALAVSPGWSKAELQWNEPWQVLANGQRMSVETFTSSLSPDAAAKALVSLRHHYERYQIGEGRILLSGIRPGRHWVAEIQGSPQGSQGYVSALYFDPARSAAPEERAVAPERRLAGAGLGLSQQVFEFENSVFVSLLKSDPALRTGLDPDSDLQLIPSGPEHGMALAVSMPER